jgi:dTDP-glucose 4,6-dehydratase
MIMLENGVILVTGGAGFIGANFVKLLHGYCQASIVILDKLTYAGDLDRLGSCIGSPRISFVQGDICDKELVKGLFERYGFKSVVHFAAESHVDRSISGPDIFLKTNVEGTVNLLSIANDFWKQREGHLFVHVSTDEVYGDLTPEEAPFTENSSYKPSSPYSASKASSDHFVRAWYRTYGFPAVVTNCSNNYGPWQFPEKLLPLMIQNALEQKALPVYGDGKQIRDWIHVEDHCRAILRVLEAGAAGETYLIGAENEVANIDMVHEICQAVDCIKGVDSGTSESFIKSVKDRPGHDRRYAVNSRKIRQELGWEPEKKLKSALLEYVQWTLEHQDWISRVRDGSYKEYYMAQYGSSLEGEKK